MPTSESMATGRGWSEMASEENLSRKNPDNLEEWGDGVLAPSSRPLPEVVLSLKALRCTSDVLISSVWGKYARGFSSEAQAPAPTEPGLRKARLVVKRVVPMCENLCFHDQLTDSYPFRHFASHRARTVPSCIRPTNHRALRSPSAPNLPEHSEGGDGSTVPYEFPTSNDHTL